MTYDIEMTIFLKMKKYYLSIMRSYYVPENDDIESDSK
jgi:hypothetical protein